MEEGYGILDFEGIWNMARDLVFSVYSFGMALDDEGNLMDIEKADALAWEERRNIDPRYKYLNFRECEELHSLSLADASELHTKEIMEKYLYETVPLIRKIMRKGSIIPYQFVSEDVPDEYLNQIICNAWKVDLMIWAHAWDWERKEKGCIESS